MKSSTKNITAVGNEALKESIIKSMIASFRIESIQISETTAYEVYEKVKKRLKK